MQCNKCRLSGQPCLAGSAAVGEQGRPHHSVDIYGKAAVAWGWVGQGKVTFQPKFEG